MRLGAVFNQLQMVLAADMHDFIHVCHMPVQMYHHYRLGFLRNLFLYLVRIYLVIFIRFHKYRSSAVDGNTHYAGNVGITLDENLVAGADAKKLHGNPQGVQAAGQTYTAF